jgi:hypothetical protein
MAVSLIDGGVMSTVNVSETYAKLIDLRLLRLSLTRY